MKITQQFFEEFLDGNDDILELGMRVLKLEILFRVHKGTIPILALLRSFTSNDIEFFLEIGLMVNDSKYVYDTSVSYTEDNKTHLGLYPRARHEGGRK
jgi:hypothetical protein